VGKGRQHRADRHRVHRGRRPATSSTQRASRGRAADGRVAARGGARRDARAFGDAAHEGNICTGGRGEPEGRPGADAGRRAARARRALHGRLGAGSTAGHGGAARKGRSKQSEHHPFLRRGRGSLGVCVLFGAIAENRLRFLLEMGEGREDTDPRPRGPGSEPRIGAGGAAASGHGRVATDVDDGPEAVDFDALHAALGDPLDLDELPPPAIDDGYGLEERVGESSGASNAAYASARPHTIPSSYSPVEDLNAPPVIIAAEDTVPGGPPNITVPFGPPQAVGHARRLGAPFVAGPPASHPNVAGGAPSGPQRVGHQGSGPHRSASARPGYAASPMKPPPGAAHPTMRMPDRPPVPPGALNGRLGKTPTLVVRPRGPSAKQKLIAFMTMLLLVTACGIAVIIWRKPRWLGLDPTVPLAPAVSTAALPDPSPAVVPAAAATSASPHPALSASAAAPPSPIASVSAVPKPKPRPPAPVVSASPPRQ